MLEQREEQRAVVHQKWESRKWDTIPCKERAFRPYSSRATIKQSLQHLNRELVDKPLVGALDMAILPPTTDPVTRNTNNAQALMKRLRY